MRPTKQTEPHSVENETRPCVDWTGFKDIYEIVQIPTSFNLYETVTKNAIINVTISSRNSWKELSDNIEHQNFWK